MKSFRRGLLLNWKYGVDEHGNNCVSSYKEIKEDGTKIWHTSKHKLNKFKDFINQSGGFENVKIKIVNRTKT
jgi:hypothetical protein